MIPGSELRDISDRLADPTQASRSFHQTLIDQVNRRALEPAAPTYHNPAITPPAALIAETLRGAIEAWGSRDSRAASPDMVTPDADAERCLAQIDQALDRLGKRTGVREDAARDWLNTTRDRLSEKLAAFRSVGPDLRGSACVALSTRLGAAMVEQRAAAVAFATSTRETMIANRDRKDFADLAVRECFGVLESLRDSLRIPRVPAATLFTEAECGTKQLRAIGKPAMRLQEALIQGATALPDVARLWPVYERADDDLDTLAWRARRFEER